MLLFEAIPAWGEFGEEWSGLNGLAASLVVQKWANFLLMKGYFIATRNSRKFELLNRTSRAELWDKLKLIFRKGFPLSIQMGSEQLYLFIFTIFAGLLSNVTHGAELDQMNILSEYFVALGVTGALVLHKTTMQRVGEVRGRDLLLKIKKEAGGANHLIETNLGNVTKIVLASGAISIVYAIGVGFVFFFADKPLVEAYTLPGNYTQQQIDGINSGISELFKILAACTITDQARHLMAGALNGLGDVDSPMLTSLLLTVGLGGGVGAALCFAADLGLEGALLSSIIAYSLGGLSLTGILWNTVNTLKKATNCDTLLEKGWKGVKNCFSFFSSCSTRSDGYEKVEKVKDELDEDVLALGV